MTDPWTEINALKPRGNGWGSALKRRVEPMPVIHERPIRPSFGGLSGKCPHCGARYFGCCEKDLEE